MHTTHKIFSGACALLMSLCAMSLYAEDIDIYAGIQADGAKPNLLIILDNSAAWDANASYTCQPNPGDTWTQTNNQGKNAGFLQCALHNAIQSISTTPSLIGNLNMGLMYFPTGSGGGGQFKYPARSPYAPLPNMTAAGINSYLNVVNALDIKADKSNNAQIGESMQEAWAFYAGKTGLSGTNYSATSAISSACQKNFVLYIATTVNNTKPQDGSGKSAENSLKGSPAASPQNAGASLAQQQEIVLPSATNKYQSSWADEWARFMYQSDLTSNKLNKQNIVTYTISVSDGSNPDYVSFMQSMAKVGGGKAFVVRLGDMTALVQALLQIFNEVQAVNSVFSSASLPVSQNSQETYLNQIFYGQFRPDQSGYPRWLGNLKQYQFGVDNSNPSDPQVFIADSTQAPALSSAGTGFFSPNAISFWTSKNTATLPDNIGLPTANVGGFWINSGVAQQSAGLGYDQPDGEIVEKGGVAQQIRLANLTTNYTTSPSSPRKLYTCTGSCAANSTLATTPFATSNSDITTALLGANSPPLGLSSITRSGTSATATLSATPTSALAAGQAVTIARSQYPGYNGTYTIGLVSGQPTKFTYTITETPPYPATGNYTAAIPSNPKVVQSISRSGNTATVSLSSPHGYTTGDYITISNAAQSAYNMRAPITVTSPTQFTYTVTEGPTTPSGGSGTVKIGATGTAQNIPSGGIVRSGLQVIITVNSNFSPAAAVGGSVIIAGGSEYDGTWTISGKDRCTVGRTTGQNNKSVCFSISTTTPASPATVASGASSIIADKGISPLVISQLTRTSNACSSGNNSQVVTASATTSTAPVFRVNDRVTISGDANSPSTETAYTGTFTIQSVSNSSPYGFSYAINVSPDCSDSTSGMTATYSGINRDDLIRWVRGADNVGDEASPGNGITTRPSVHGDVLHSRPTTVNYGASTGVVVFYGDNGGVFHAINGNQTASIGSGASAVPPGGELWGFIPTEFFPKLARLYNNSPAVKYASTPSQITPTPQSKDYFFDGSSTVYQSADKSKVYLYLSARRGGRLLYALDITDPTNPKFLWKRSNSDSGFSELGQTWSAPKVALVKGNTNPVLIFGAGYDTTQDSEPPATDTMGRGIFILDAFTGNIVWQARYSSTGSTSTCSGTPCNLSSMVYSFPSDVRLVDRDADTYTDRVYAPDVGGNIWRIDFEPSAGNLPANWKTTLFASLGGTGNTKRKIFYPPDVVLTKNYDALLVPTGDREHPIYPLAGATNTSYNIVNRFYMLKDTRTGKDANNPSSWNAIVDATSATSNSAPTTSSGASVLFNATSTPYNNSAQGFYITLSNAGEKGVNAPATSGGITYFATNQPIAPDANICQANLGTARGYQVNFITGETNTVIFDGGGLPPSPVTGVVSVSIDDTSTLIPFVIGGGNATGGSSLQGNKTKIPLSGKRKRTYWYREHDQ